MSRSRLNAAAPHVVSCSLIAGNLGLLLKRGLHPNMETAAGLLWILAAYALRSKARHPVAAPRLNAAGTVLGSLCLALSGLLLTPIDWRRVRTPLGYLPAAVIVGLQKELRAVGVRLLGSQRPSARICGALLARPFLLAALVNAYGVVELARSAQSHGDLPLLAISAAYGLATACLPLLDEGPGGGSRIEARHEMKIPPQPAAKVE